MLRDFLYFPVSRGKRIFVDSPQNALSLPMRKERESRISLKKRESLMKERLSDSETLSFKNSTKKFLQFSAPTYVKKKSIKFQNHSSYKEKVLSNDVETKKLPIS